MKRIFPESPRRYHSLHLSAREAVLYKPSTWPSSSIGDPYSYGLRLRGCYIVDLDNDIIIPFEINSLKEIHRVMINDNPISDYIGDDILLRNAYTIIASAASPGGLYSKMVSRHARGVYVVLPSVTLNVDIVRGKLADSGYSIAVPIISKNTVVRTNIVLMNDMQSRLMDLSEIKGGNYYIAGYDNKDTALSFFLEKDGSYKTSIPTISYFGMQSGLCIGKDTFLGMNIQATNRPVNIVESSLDHYFSEVYYIASVDKNPIRYGRRLLKARSGNELLLKLRYAYKKRKGDAHKIIGELNRRLEEKKCFSKRLYNKRIRPIHDPYIRDENKNIMYNRKGIALSKDYDPGKVYSKYKLSKTLF
ncbi:MAG: hypothetical protein ACMXYL_01015 [Candidatus Woesearchaeota archaeon]